MDCLATGSYVERKLIKLHVEYRRTKNDVEAYYNEGKAVQIDAKIRKFRNILFGWFETENNSKTLQYIRFAI